MKRLLAVTSLLAALASVWWTNAAAIDALTSRDVAAIRHAVEEQLDALASDDAERAFKLASAEQQVQIGTPANFMRLIKRQYNPLYHYRRAFFAAPNLVHGTALQVARVTADDSHVWLAIFRMQREKDLSWRIAGCQLVDMDSTAI